MKISDFVDRGIKWTSELEDELARRNRIIVDPINIQRSAYRPFVSKWTYFAKPITHRPYQNFDVFPDADHPNITIAVVVEARAGFAALALNRLPNKDFFMPSAAQHFARYRYTPSGERIDNITDWALKTFTTHYGKAAGVTRDRIFHYVYAALHDPLWRETYAINLRREFPRIPLHPGFAPWADAGAALMALHLGYETVEPWPLTRTDTPDPRARAGGQPPRPILKSDPAAGTVTLDSETVLSGIPASAWTYRLGNRTAIDWVLDQHKEKTPKDPTIRARFDTYRFADHKDRVADLIARVTRVSVETVGIVDTLRALPRASTVAGDTS